MIRLLFWIVVLGLVWLAVEGRVPIPGIPDDEIVYATTPPVSTCTPTGCLVVYTLELANVGRSAESGLKVRLREEPLAAATVPPTLRRATETTVLQANGERAGVAGYLLGAVAPEERVALVFALRTPTRDAAPSWDRLLVGVDPTHGSALPGDPGALTGGRVVHATARVLERIVAAVRAAVHG
jgi:hypothetical protein